ncbi:MAG TPA: 5-formyltetrahydrofolate cyclo-ligase [Polyangia bacterium]|jgi:5-formyltetrahydrofolate cyclo-ligase|nr:5-formyltetrahydrofolate cyclo-ligase [Polyangia bacterium]
MAHSPSSQQLADEKRALRRVMVQRRELLTPSERVALCQAVSARLQGLPAFASANTVSGFVAIQNEIDPAAALASAQRRGAVVALPRVSDGVPRLRFHRAKSSDTLVPGPFGLAEPPASAPEVDAQDLDLMLVPGLAFDLAGRRVGFGKGYYDEVAARIKGGGRGLLVGLAYDFQIVPRCPAGDGDVSVDWIVTDQRAVACEAQP